MKKGVIKVGFCVAYDWELLKNSLSLVYAHADTICLSIDKNRKSWSGLPYKFDEKAFIDLVSYVDIESKIDIYEDDFCLPQLNAIENDNRQRNMMAKRMGVGGWHIQIDSDEYFIDFEEFCNYLRQKNTRDKEINYSAVFIPVVKKLPEGYLVVKFEDRLETVPMATNLPLYEGARRNGYFNHITPFVVIHETWSRDDDTLSNKLKSWGHVDDFDTNSYFQMWKALDSNNYQYIANFHPIDNHAWPQLDFIKAKNHVELIQHFRNDPIRISKYRLLIKNSRLLAKLKSFLNG